MFSNLGRREDDLLATEEALAIYRRLAEARPDAFLPDLAMSLNNLGGALADLGRRREALRAVEEAVKLRRTLATARPEAFLPNLAKSLMIYSLILGDSPRAGAAAAREALEIYLPFARQHPSAFASQFLGALQQTIRMKSFADDAQGDDPLIFEAVQTARELHFTRGDS